MTEYQKLISRVTILDNELQQKFEEMRKKFKKITGDETREKLKKLKEKE